MENIIKDIINKKKKNKKIVFTNGCFDVLHYGHVRLLKKARQLGDILVVGLNSDASVSRLKGKGRPFFPQNIRLNMLESIKYVDFVVIFEEDTPLELVKKICPDFIVKGSDYSPEEVVGKHFIEKYGGRVIIIKRTENFSTTDILNGVRKKFDRQRQRM